MNRQSVRDLKAEIAHTVFGPLANAVLSKASRSKGLALAAAKRVALGVALGDRRDDFKLAVRLQSKSPVLAAIVETLRERTRGEIDVRFIGRMKMGEAGAVGGFRTLTRPVAPGLSVAHLASSAGTLGLIARHRKTQRPGVVSNSHVLARCGLASLGDPICQPGPLDGGVKADRIGALLAFQGVDTAVANHVDCALALLDDGLTYDPVPMGLGSPIRLTPAPIESVTTVRKIGRTTGMTKGRISVTELDDVVVDYAEVGAAIFDDQIEVTGSTPGAPFSDSGDSGSLVFDEAFRAVGLLFAGSPEGADGAGVSYVNPIARVIAALDIESL
jgi:hypothetical protein